MDETLRTLRINAISILLCGLNGVIQLKKDQLNSRQFQQKMKYLKICLYIWTLISFRKCFSKNTQRDMENAA